MSKAIACPNEACRHAIPSPLDVSLEMACPRCGRRFLPSTTAHDSETATRSLPGNPTPESEGPASPSDVAATWTMGGAAVESEATDGLPATAPRRVGRFRVEAFLGAGAFGDVYRARDPHLERDVALKLAKPEMLSSPERVERFLREARAAAGLQHPHIVAVHDAGNEEGRYYIASAFIRGETLEHRLKQARPDTARTARWIRQLAEALAYAHRQGVVHRDVKPANVMIDERDEPSLMDFGLARRHDDEHARTQDGKILGTPQYMAPEQARGDSAAVGPASDQYALGVLLFEALTGRAPFVGTVELVLFHHCETDPPRPRSIDRRISRDLETICLKCLEKSPARRYADCAALAEDLRRQADGEPIAARRIGTLERAGKWCRKNPLSASLSALVALTLIVGAAVAGFFAWQSNDNAVRYLNEAIVSKTNEKRANTNEKSAKNALAESEKQRKAADESDRESARRLVRLLVADGWRAVADGDSLAALPKFVQAFQADSRNPLAEPTHRLRIAATLRTCPRLVQAWFPEHGASSAVFSPDGRLVLSAGADGAQLWDVESGEAVGKPLRQSSALEGAEFSPDGKRIVTWTFSAGRTSAGAQLWNAADGEPIGKAMQLGTQINRASFSSDGRYVRLALTWVGHPISIFDGTTGEPAKAPWMESKATNRDAVFAGQATRVLEIVDSSARLWDHSTGKALGATFQLAGEFRHLSAEGTRVLSVESFKKHFDVQDAATGRRVRPAIETGRTILQAILSPDGTRAATVYEQEMWEAGSRPLKPAEAQIWDVDTGRPIGVPFRLGEDVKNVAFASNGDQVLTIGATEARLWDVVSGLPVTPPLRHRQGLHGVRISPDSRRILTRGNGSLRLWDLAVTDFLRGINPSGPIAGARYGMGGPSAIALSSDDRSLLLNVLWRSRSWDARTTQPLAEFSADGFGSGVARFSPKGDLVAGGGWVQEGNQSFAAAFVWDAQSGKVAAGPLRHDNPVLKPGQPHVQTLAFHPDGTSLATGGQDGSVRLWDVRTGRPLGEPKQHGNQIKSVAFSGDGSHLLSVADPGPPAIGEVRVWDTKTGSEFLGLAFPKASYAAVLRFDGQSVAVAANSQGDGTGAPGVVEVRAIPGGALVGEPMPQRERVTVMTFRGDGRRLFVGCADGSARIYDAETGIPVTPILAHPIEVSQAIFSRDGRLVFTSCGTDGFAPTSRIGEVRVWDAETSEAVVPPFRHRKSVRTLAVTSAEDLLIAGGEDLVRFWDLSRDARPIADLNLLARLLSETEVDPQGHPTILSLADYRRAWEQYRRRVPPAERLPGPEQVTAWHTREAIGSEMAEEWRSAERHLEALLAIRPTDEQLHARLGFVRFRREDWQGAAASLGRSLELKNKDWNVRFVRGRALAELGKWRDAIREFDAVLQVENEEWDIHYERGRAHQEIGQFERAEADCTEAIALLGGRRKGVNLGSMILNQQSRLAALNGKWGPWFMRGRARHDQGKHQFAVDDYNVVIEAAPRHAWALRNRGICRRLLGSYDDAMNDFDAAENAGSDDPRIWSGRGWIEAHRGEWRTAAADYAEALRRKPNTTDPWFEAALVRLRLDDRAGHRAVCAAMLPAFSEGSLYARLNVALACGLADDGVDDWQTLRKWCEEAAAANPNNISVKFLIGAILYRQGNFEEAGKSLRSVTKEGADHHAIAGRFLAAMVFQRLGQKDEATRSLAEGAERRKALPAAIAWNDQVLLDVLHREAEELVLGKKRDWSGSSEAAAKRSRVSAPAPVPLPANLGDNKGRLARDDPAYRGAPARIHTIDFKADRSYIIDVESTDFDTFLILQDAQGQPLAENDDGGGLLNSRLYVRPTMPGQHRLVVTSYDRKVGGYVLRIAEVKSLPEPTRPSTKSTLVAIKAKSSADKLVQYKQGDFIEVTAEATDANGGIAITITLEGDEKYAVAQDARGVSRCRATFLAPADGAYRIVVDNLGASAVDVEVTYTGPVTDDSPARQPGKKD
jgi:eukaryotic-like serine/threonine-protein kinase